MDISIHLWYIDRICVCLHRMSIYQSIYSVSSVSNTTTKGELWKVIKKKKEEEEDKLLWGPRNGGTAQEQVILCPYQRNVPWTWYFLTSNIAREGSQTRLIPSLDQKGSHSNTIKWVWHPPYREWLGSPARCKRIKESSPPLPGPGCPL